MTDQERSNLFLLLFYALGDIEAVTERNIFMVEMVDADARLNLDAIVWMIQR